MTNTFKVLLLALPLLVTGCDKWFDVKPANEQTYDEYWTSKEEVHSVMMGAYSGMRKTLEKLVQWGELRGDVMDLGPAKSGDEMMNNVRDLEIQPTLAICKYDQIYTVISRCNSVIKFAPGVMKADNSFTEKSCNAYIAEAKWLRSLCYFYLVRTFRDVPYVTQPMLDDAAGTQLPKVDGDLILKYLVADLTGSINDLPIEYEKGSSWQNKGRGTMFAGYALLADIYLWMGRYSDALKAIATIESSGRYRLLDQEEWYDIYYPGNSEESIFELNWDKADYDQGNNLFQWFHNADQNASYIISDAGKAFYGEEATSTDIRGVNGTYLSANGKVWKYAGTAIGGTDVREANFRDANWIIYRYADILLMKAEALVMTYQYKAAYDIVQQIRTRAAVTESFNMPTDESAALDMVLDERARELAFEGKRWFDLVRVAIRDDGRYKDKLIQLLLKNVTPSLRPLYESKLQNTYGYYLPLHESEIDASGGVLIQNPYYE